MPKSVKFGKSSRRDADKGRLTNCRVEEKQSYPSKFIKKCGGRSQEDRGRVGLRKRNDLSLNQRAKKVQGKANL